jgi:hypothetical protein
VRVAETAAARSDRTEKRGAIGRRLAGPGTADRNDAVRKRKGVARAETRAAVGTRTFVAMGAAGLIVAKIAAGIGSPAEPESKQFVRT